MSDFSQGDGWWQASDGKWYPPEQAAGYQPPVGAPGPRIPAPRIPAPRIRAAPTPPAGTATRRRLLRPAPTHWPSVRWCRPSPGWCCCCCASASSAPSPPSPMGLYLPQADPRVGRGAAGRGPGPGRCHHRHRRHRRLPAAAGPHRGRGRHVAGLGAARSQGRRCRARSRATPGRQRPGPRGLLVDAEPRQDPGSVLELEQGEQHVLGADVVVAQPQRLAERQLEAFLASASKGISVGTARPAGGSAARRRRGPRRA